MISVFDMFSIGIGPSSSHTVGPMRAANDFVRHLQASGELQLVTSIKVELFGSLGQTGIGHGTGKAVILGLLGETPETVEVDQVDAMLQQVADSQTIQLAAEHQIAFPSKGAIIFHRKQTLPLHSNGMTIQVVLANDATISQSYYSIGGGFIIKEQDFAAQKNQAIAISETDIPYAFESAAELLAICQTEGISISTLMLKNEQCFLDRASIEAKLWEIWQVMQACIERGISTEGILPGGLKVARRAPGLYRRLSTEQTSDPIQAMDWVNLFALAVNEENAAGGRVVTAPTNGAAGIIPAVLSYYNKYVKTVDKEIACRYLLTAAAIGVLYKKNASISGAEVGCQGEVGVACSMAAGALTEILGGNPREVENAAEIGMEHNLGLTCDPVGGLVQVPCIERNAMGAIKAINASRLAMRGNGTQKVTLDKVIKTMWDTGNDMKSKYKETARGGLAVNIIEC